MVSKDVLRIGQNIYSIFIKNRGSTSILTNLVWAHPRNIHTQFEANAVWDEFKLKKKMFMPMTTDTR